MATWSATPNTNVSIDQSTGEFTFPKNTTDENITYTISYTSNTNCTGVTTYTVPKCTYTPPVYDCFSYYIAEDLHNNLNGADLLVSPTTKENASPMVNITVNCNEFGTVNTSGKYSFDVKRLRYHECDMSNYTDEYIPGLSLENVTLDGGSGAHFENTSPTFSVSYGGAAYISIIFSDGYIEVEWYLNGSQLIQNGKDTLHFHFFSEIWDVENHEDVNIGSLVVDLEWNN